jgi:hypothetical protein
MRGQKRVEDARERAYDPRIHLLARKPYEDGWIAGSSPAMTSLPARALARERRPDEPVSRI